MFDSPFDFLTLVIGKQNLPFAITFGAMAFSTFVFDTLDVCMRLGRYIVQELFGFKGRFGAFVGTLATVLLPFFLVLTAPKGAYLEFWTLFGASNQLLAGLTLLSISAWLYHARQRIAFTLIPMFFVLVITLWALISLAIGNFQTMQGFDMKFINAVTSLALVGLSIYLIIAAAIKLRGERQKMEPPNMEAVESV